MKDEMLDYIRNTMELNRSLYEITNSSNVSEDTSVVEEIKKEKETSGKTNGLYTKEVNKGIKKFHESYERFEDKLICNDAVTTVWETGEKLSEVISVELSSNFIGSKSKKVYFVSKSLLTVSNCIFTAACWAVISSSYILKSSFKSIL
jgi:hypothetical protein